jgi:hypothetical protein
MRTLRRWLIIRDGDDCRIVTKNPTLGRGLNVNEVCVEIVIKAPEPPKTIASVLIELPTPPPTTATAATVTYGEDTDEDFALALEAMDES